MNASRDKTFTLAAPAGVAAAAELVSGKPVALANPIRIGPMSTAVLYLGK